MLLGVLIALVLFALAVWLGRRVSLLQKSEKDLRSALLLIDETAFHNLIRRDEDEFLKSVLTRRNYRTAKRARTRAVQQYLRWIAQDCLVLQMLIRSAPTDRPEVEERMRVLAVSSFRLRLAMLAVWGGLWCQWAFPNLDLTPGSLLAAYEEFAARMRVYLTFLDRKRRMNAEHPAV